MTKMSSEEFSGVKEKHLEWLEEGKGDDKDERRMNLTNVDLSAIDNELWKGVSFRWATLKGVSLSTKQLMGVDFNFSIIRGCNFRSVKFNGCTFESASIVETTAQFCGFYAASFNRARVEWSDMSYSDLSFSTWDIASVSRVNLCGAETYRSGIIYGGCDSRGYAFYALKYEHGIRILAGCRNFGNFEEARKHWRKYKGNREEEVYQSALACVTHLRTMAIAKGWMR